MNLLIFVFLFLCVVVCRPMFVFLYFIMKRKLYTVVVNNTPISTKQTITSRIRLLDTKNPQHMAFESDVHA
jgi:hypothetical protein